MTLFLVLWFVFAIIGAAIFHLALVLGRTSEWEIAESIAEFE